MASSIHLNPVPCQFQNPRTTKLKTPHLLRISADSAPKARFVARRTESVSVRPLGWRSSLMVVAALSSCLVRSPLNLIWYGHAASMENKISCGRTGSGSAVQELTSDATIEVSTPFAFRAIPAEAIESTGSQVLNQILKAMLPRFMSQLVKDYLGLQETLQGNLWGLVRSETGQQSTSVFQPFCVSLLFSLCNIVES